MLRFREIPKGCHDQGLAQGESNREDSGKRDWIALTGKGRSWKQKVEKGMRDSFEGRYKSGVNHLWGEHRGTTEQTIKQ